jgi:hypothetical protein
LFDGRTLVGKWGGGEREDGQTARYICYPLSKNERKLAVTSRLSTPQSCSLTWIVGEGELKWSGAALTKVTDIAIEESE